MLCARDLIRPRAMFTERLRALLLAIWIGLAVLTSLLSDDAPNFLRTLPMFPALMILSAWACVWVGQQLRTQRLRRAYLVLLAFGIGLSAWLTYRDYFETFARLPGTYYAYDADKVEIAEWVNARAKNAQVYLAPLYYHQGTIAFLTRNTLLKTFDSRDTIILPARDTARDAYGEIDASGFLKMTTTRAASWENKIQLLGARVEPLGIGRRQLAVTLMLQALAPLSREFSFSVKVRNADGVVWGQQDKMAGSNSFPTTQWTPGETIVERFMPEFDVCPPPGKYAVTIEVYAPDENRTLMLDDQNENVLELETVRARENCVWSARNVK